LYGPVVDPAGEVEIQVGKDFSGRLPNDIIKIVVTGPNEKLPIAKSDFTYLPQLRDFYNVFHSKESLP